MIETVYSGDWTAEEIAADMKRRKETCPHPTEYQPHQTANGAAVLSDGVRFCRMCDQYVALQTPAVITEAEVY